MEDVTWLFIPVIFIYFYIFSIADPLPKFEIAVSYLVLGRREDKQTYWFTILFENIQYKLGVPNVTHIRAKLISRGCNKERMLYSL